MKTCSTCQIEKEPADFPAKGAQCKACISAKQKAAYQAKKTGGAKGGKKRATRAPSERAADSLYHRPAGMGFKVQLEVDEASGQTDIRMDQFNPSTQGDQSIWLNQLEARELLSWLSEKLGL